MTGFSLSGVRRDRAAGVLLAQGCGDALGVAYEFKPPMPRDERAEMKGSGVFGPGEWSDDTEMAVCIAGALDEHPAGSDAMYERVAELFLAWTFYARDTGIQTREVLGEAHDGTGSAAERCWEAARRYTERRMRATGRGGAGNGALMRTGILGLVSLGDRETTAEVVRRVAALTHVDDDVEDSCVLWTEAVRAAVLKDWDPDEGFAPKHLLAGLDLIPEGRQARWEAIVREATGAEPWSFGSNGWTVKTFKAAWAAITSTPVPPLDPAGGSFPCQHLEHALDAAVHTGWDTDTVAAVAGQLLGARWGASAVPAKWMRKVWGRGPSDGGAGYADWRARDVVRVGVTVTLSGAGRPVGPDEWPRARRVDNPGAATPRAALVHPADDGVCIGGATSLEHGCDAAVSVCRVGTDEPIHEGMDAGDRVELMLVDDPTGTKNRNLHFSLDDGARATCQMRHEGRRVLVHCVKTESRSPSLAARYGVLRGRSADEAREEVRAALEPWRGFDYAPTPSLWGAVGDLGENREGCERCPYQAGDSGPHEEFHPCR